jgi:hypothetical protein
MGMAGVSTESIHREGAGAAAVKFSLQTSVGRFPVEFSIDAGHSMGDIEKSALQKLETILTEALEAVRLKLK